ncbi:ERF family protein [Clostridium sp.]|uniref:ERF family protein n=1 Tax=Clostridium sp. TaxID=1506 RepID=UPI0026063E32|nr:ERF family protein [Clostridium sp.]
MPEEKNKLNVLEKLQKVRTDLQEIDLKKTGKNSHSNYSYFELKDFLPSVAKLCDKHGINPIFNITREIATLLIYDCDDIEKFISFDMPIEITDLRGCNAIQSIGGALTYAKRYLYMNAFEIAEADATELEGDEKGARDPISSVHAKVIDNLIKETNTDLMNFCTWAKVKEIKEIENRDLAYCMKMLNEKKEKMLLEKKKGIGGK